MAAIHKCDFLKVGDEYLDMEQRYKLVTKAYLGKGKDGYDSFSKAEVNLQPSHKSPLTQLSCHQSAASRLLKSNTIDTIR